MTARLPNARLCSKCNRVRIFTGNLTGTCQGCRTTGQLVLCRIPDCGRPVPPSFARNSRYICSRCYSSRSRGDLRNEPTDTDLDRMIEEQRPTMPEEAYNQFDSITGGRGKQFKKLKPRPAKPTLPKWRTISTWLTEDTSPETIAAAQRLAVVEALKHVGRKASVAEISEAAVLPTSVVRRRLKEMGRKVA